MDDEKFVDESWKDRVEGEKEGKEAAHQHSCGCGHDGDHECEGEMEFNFLTYISSLAFQAMIFLGLMPNPMAEEKIERDLRQAKLIIDTLIVLRDKTKGNLTEQEAQMLNSAVYELELRYVEAVGGGEQKSSLL